MYVRGPGVPQGVISKLPTTHLDITATILELTGTIDGPATPSNLDGLSFAPALKDTAAAAKLRDTPELWRDFSFSEFFMNDVTWWNVRTVNSTHKFSFHYWCQGVPEVFNLLEDPLQVRQSWMASLTHSLTAKDQNRHPIAWAFHENEISFPKTDLHQT